MCCTDDEESCSDDADAPGPSHAPPGAKRTTKTSNPNSNRAPTAVRGDPKTRGPDQAPAAALNAVDGSSDGGDGLQDDEESRGPRQPARPWNAAHLAPNETEVLVERRGTAAAAEAEDDNAPKQPQPLPAPAPLEPAAAPSPVPDADQRDSKADSAPATDETAEAHGDQMSVNADATEDPPEEKGPDASSGSLEPASARGNNYCTPGPSSRNGMHGKHYEAT